MKNIIFISLCIISTNVCAVSMDYYGELYGKIGYGALSIDVYLDKCFSSGYKLDNNLHGVDKIGKEKFGVTYTELMIFEEQRSGRSYRDEAEKMFDNIVHKLNGCKSKEFKDWVNKLYETHRSNLAEFENIPVIN